MSFPSQLQDLLAEGRVVVRGGAKIEFGGGDYGTWSGNYELDHEGLTYVPNQLLSAEAPDATLGMEAGEFVITMPEAGDFGVTPDVLAQIEQEDYKGRPVTLYEFYFDPDTRALLHVEPLAYGYVDFIDHVQENGQLRLEGHVIDGAVDNHRDGYRTASHEDQQLVSPGDLGFEHAGKVKTEYHDIEL